jgi:uncharacterized protein YndB with AHSA1/START domain
VAQETDNNPCDTDGAAHAYDLVLKRTFDAPPEKVFKAWTDPELLKKWFAPQPWSLPEAAVDLRPGGQFRVTMRSPDGEEFPNSGVFLEVIPGRRIISTDGLTPDWKPTGQPFMVTRIDFEPTADGGTAYTATASHWTEAAMKQHEQMGFHEGWGQCADQLGELVKTL